MKTRALIGIVTASVIGVNAATDDLKIKPDCTFEPSSNGPVV